MALFPITGCFASEYMPQVVAVDIDDTMEQVAHKIASHSTGVQPEDMAAGTVLEIFVDEQRIEPHVTLGSLSLEPMQWVSVRERRRVS